MTPGGNLLTIDTSALAGDLADNVGGQYLDAIVSVLPSLIPYLISLWAIGFVWKKLAPRVRNGFDGGGGGYAAGEKHSDNCCCYGCEGADMDRQQEESYDRQRHGGSGW